MDATLQQFIDTMHSDGSIPPELTDAMLSRYPFFSLPAVLELKQSAATMTDERRQHLSACVALNAPDGESLMKLIDPDGKRLAALYPPEDTDNTPSTDDAINTFLDTYGKIDEREQALLERLIFNPVPDYSSVLAVNTPKAIRPTVPKANRTAASRHFWTASAPIRMRSPSPSHALAITTLRSRRPIQL